MSVTLNPSRTSARVLLAASLVVLSAIVLAWFVWPDPTPSADLVAGPASITAASDDVPAASGTTSPVSTAPAPSVPIEAPPTDLSPPPSSPAAPAPPTTRRPSVAAPPPQPVVAAPGQPTRLEISSIGVDVGVVDVGLQGDGQMEVPPASLVGWYRLGPMPGQAGSAVLAAHIDYGGQRGAFFSLPRVQVGDTVVVTTDAGAVRYVVTDRAQIAKADVDLARYFTNDGPPRLTLITCGGAFNSGSGHYQDNIIITATPG